MPTRTVNADRAAMPRASASAASISCPCGTTRFTRPMRCASAASIISPVSSISIAALRGTARASATAGVEQNSPISTPGVAKRAWSDATARSQVATSWQPAAVATPCTTAITGCGSATIACITRAQVDIAWS